MNENNDELIIIIIIHFNDKLLLSAESFQINFRFA